MTTYTGWIYPTPELYQQPLTTSLDDGLDRWSSFGLVEVGQLLLGSLSHSGSTTRVSHGHSGYVHPSWDSFLFGHILIVPPRLDMGNVLSSQVVTLEIANLFTTEQNWEDLIDNVGEGVGFINLPSFPETLPPFGSYTLQISVSELGPELIDGSLLFDFESEDIVVPVTGVRVVGWPWEPNWNEPVVERLEWRTDVHDTYDGSDQTIELRGNPRQYWEFEYTIQDDVRRLFENALFDWSSRVWALPVLSDMVTLEAEFTAGNTSIPVTPGNRAFRPGGVAMVIGDNATYESFEIDSVEVDSIELSRPLINTWPMGSRIYPVVTARLQGQRGTTHPTRNLAYGTAQFQSVEEIPLTTPLVESTYRSYPVQTIEPNWIANTNIEYLREEEVFDPGFGRAYYKDRTGLARPIHRILWTCLNRAEADQMRGWLYNRRGKSMGIWVPTWQQDISIKETIGAAATSIDFERCGVVQFAKNQVHRRDIRIELKTGQIFYRRTGTEVLVNPTTERLTIDSSLGIEVTPDQIERVSWMNFVRLQHDMVELAWYNGEVVEVSLILQGVRNDF